MMFSPTDGFIKAGGGGNFWCGVLSAKADREGCGDVLEIGSVGLAVSVLFAEVCGSSSVDTISRSQSSLRCESIASAA